jgi:hypothetical protein
LSLGEVSVSVRDAEGNTGRKPVSSCLAQGNYRVHFRRAPRWKVAG